MDSTIVMGMSKAEFSHTISGNLAEMGDPAEEMKKNQKTNISSTELLSEEDGSL